MRPYWSRLRRCAWSASFALSCVSSLQFSGCLNRSGRDLSAELTRDAPQSALKAEQDIAERRRGQALADAKPPASPGKGDAEAKVAKSADSKAGQVSLEELLANERPKNAVELARGISTDDEETPAISLAGGDRPATKTASPARPFPGQEPAAAPKQAAPEKPADAGNPFAAAKVSAAESTPKTRVVGPTPPAEWPGASERNVAPAKAAATAAANTTAGTSAAKEAPAWATGTALTAAAPAEPTPRPSQNPLQAKSSAVRPGEREQRLRIKALMSEAHTHAMRGEMHAAYRSALLAEKIAEDHKIVLGQHEEQPADFARSVAAKIWRTPDDSSAATESTDASARSVELAAAAPSLPQQPVAVQAASHDSAFSDWGALNNWTSLPASHETSVKPSAASALPREQEAAKLPEIRPSFSTTFADPFEPRAIPAPFAEQGSELVPSSQTAEASPPNRLHSIDPFAPEGGVKFAIAESIQSAPEGTPARPLASVAEANSTVPPLFGGDRPVLLAPQAPSGYAAASATEPEIAWDRIAGRTAAASPKSVSRGQRIFWGFMGLAGAAVALFVGIRLNSKDLSETTLLAEATDAEPEEEKLESPPLRIKHAA